MDRGDTVQAQQWLGIPVQRLLGERIQTLINQPHIEKAASFDVSVLMAQILKGKHELYWSTANMEPTVHGMTLCPKR